MRIIPFTLAFTLGCTKAYEQAFSEGPVEKQPGGYAFESFAEADRYRLGPEFAEDFPGRDPSTFLVYGLRVGKGERGDYLKLTADNGLYRSLIGPAEVFKLKLLTQQEVDELPDRIEVMILWSGGNGPWRYIISHRQGLTYVLNRRPDHSEYLSSQVDFVGFERWHTQVWVPEP
jgi:hypothetical protein